MSQERLEIRARVQEALGNAEGVKEILGLTVGAASMCWKDVHLAGVFESEAAQAIVEEAYEELIRRWPIIADLRP